MSWLSAAAKKISPPKAVQKQITSAVSAVSNKLTPSKQIQSAVMTAVDPGGLIRKVGAAVGAKDISLQTPLGGQNSAANQVLKAGVNPMGAAGILASQISGEKKDAAPAPAPEAPGKFSLSAGEQNAALATQDRYSNQSMTDAINRRYEAMGQLAQGQNQAASTGEQNVLKRRMSAMGALNSGQGLKMLSQQQDASARRGSDAQLQMQAAKSGEIQTSTENNQKLNEGARQYDAEYRLNNQIAENNITMAKEAAKANNEGFFGSLFNSIFGRGISMNSITGK